MIFDVILKDDKIKHFKMKKNLTLLLFLSIHFLAFNQNYSFITASGHKTLKEKAVYKRLVSKLDKNLWEVKDYYLNGYLQMLGYYTDKSFAVSKQTDTITRYYLNGNIESKVVYKNGKKNGKYTHYFFDGSLKTSGNYLNDKLHGSYIEWYFNGNKKYEFEYDNGIPIGKWVWYDSDELIIISLDNASLSTVEEISHAHPKLKNNMSVSEYIKLIEYPNFDYNDYSIGLTHIEFTFDKHGNLSAFDIIIPSHSKFETAVIEHIKNMPVVSPAKKFGEDVESHFIVRLNFSSKDNKYELPKSTQADFYYNSAIKHLKLMDVQKAVDRLSMAAHLKRHDSEITYLLAESYFKIDKIHEACRWWLQTFNLDSEKVAFEKLKICL